MYYQYSTISHVIQYTMSVHYYKACITNTVLKATVRNPVHNAHNVSTLLQGMYCQYTTISPVIQYTMHTMSVYYYNACIASTVL